MTKLRKPNTIEFALQNALKNLSEEELKNATNKSKSHFFKCGDPDDHNHSLTINDAWLGWELFRFIEANDDDGNLFISSWTHSDQFLSSDADGNVFCTNTNNKGGEKWQVERGDSGVRLRSVAHQRYLTIQGGEVGVGDDDEASSSLIQ